MWHNTSMATAGREIGEKSEPIDQRTTNLIDYWKQLNRGQMPTTNLGEIAPETIAAGLLKGIKSHQSSLTGRKKRSLNPLRYP